MAARKITWTTKANQERKEILDYWFKRNKSKTFSKKLNKLFIETLKHIADNPGIGRKTSFEHVRVKIVRNYPAFL
jgi:toxin YoeB